MPWQPSIVRQWCMTASQDNAEAGRAPSSASAAEPEKAMSWPTVHWKSAAGVAMVGSGEAEPACTRRVATSVSPAGSVTRTDTSMAPAVV